MATLFVTTKTDNERSWTWAKIVLFIAVFCSLSVWAYKGLSTGKLQIRFGGELDKSQEPWLFWWGESVMIFLGIFLGATVVLELAKKFKIKD